MTDVERYIDEALSGVPPEVDWKVAPWAAAQLGLHWLGLAPGPAPGSRGAHDPLSASDVRLLSDRILRTFLDERQGLVWSSGRLEAALAATVSAVKGPPEALLRSAWDLLGELPLDARSYNFCRDLGRATLGRYRSVSGWDLEWLTAPGSPSQVCLRYWTLGVKPSLFTEALERESKQILDEYPFQF